MGSNKLLYIGLGVALLIAAGYFFFFRTSDTGPALTTEGTGDAMSDSAAADREFLVLLQQLEGIKLDTGILKDPAFTSLQNFRIEPTPQPVGRTNPFAPVGR
jgi:hypothetical protein